ncbi:unnamed protein product [Moneuplotes crassus]|uniref:Uncharacterized protein n=2 Tax=Euplotes crassus TaxID=5936 RepID=A0AAD1XIR6_EUPCR|nr:unnamed protein product [Moneuplotes crassus]
MGDNTGNDMATRILKKECQLEMTLKSDVSPLIQFQEMQALLQIYSQAIEYYQSVESDLYIDLNLRMQNLLARPDILEMIDRQAALKNEHRSRREESIRNQIIQSQFSSSTKTPDKFDDRLGRIIEENRCSHSPETRASTVLFEHLNDQSEGNSDDEDEQPFGRSTFCLKDLNSLTKERSDLRSTCNGVAQLQVDGHSNEFVYHKNDRRNRHGVSFKVCKNKKDGALLRPKRICKNQEKEKIHSELLNENNEELKTEPLVEASKKVVEEYHEETKDGTAISVVVQDMRDQESSLRIRLLKRERMLAKRKLVNTSQSLSDSAGSSLNQ